MNQNAVFSSSCSLAFLSTEFAAWSSVPFCTTRQSTKEPKSSTQMPTVILTVTPLKGSMRSQIFSNTGIDRNRMAPRFSSPKRRLIRIRRSTRLSEVTMISLSDIDRTGSFSFLIVIIEYAYHTLGRTLRKDGIPEEIGRQWQAGALSKRRIYKENQCR